MFWDSFGKELPNCQTVKLDSSKPEEPNLEQDTESSISSVDSVVDQLPSSERPPIPVEDREESVVSWPEEIIDGDGIGDEPEGENAGELTGNIWKYVSLASSADSENRLIVPVDCGGHSEQALIDSGAAVSMVHQSWVVARDIPMDEANLREMSGFGAGNTIPIIGSVTLHLQIHNLSLAPVKFFVISSKCPQIIPFLLGYDFLSQNNLTVSLGRKRLRQQTGDVVVDYYAGDSESSCQTIFCDVPCFATDSAIVAAGGICVIPIKWDSDSVGRRYCDLCSTNPAQVYFEGSHLCKQIQVFSGIIGTGDCRVMVSNESNHPRKIKKGELLGTTSCCRRAIL